MRKNLLCFILLLSSLAALAQDPTPPAGMQGIELRTWLLQNWYNPYHNTLGYTPAREIMYGTIDNTAGQIYCVYTGFYQPASFTSFPDPINTEHTVPQSWFNSMEPMRSDIHHIFPTHMDVNNARGSLPFGEVIDSQTDDWFIGNGSGITVTSSIPTSNIDDYSEVYSNNHFEPKEATKGNTARAIFYFYTMYPNQAGDISLLANINTLYQWHLDDPVDAMEINRDNLVQQYQGNYNPYIHSPELLPLAWGFTTSLSEQKTLDFTLFPIPTHDCLSIQVQSSILQAHAYNLIGEAQELRIEAGSIDISFLSPGVYSLLLSTEEGVGVRRFVVE